MVYAVLTGTGKGYVSIDIIETDKAHALRHAKELREKFGCEDARVKAFADDEAAYAWEERNA